MQQGQVLQQSREKARNGATAQRAWPMAFCFRLYNLTKTSFKFNAIDSSSIVDRGGNFARAARNFLFAGSFPIQPKADVELTRKGKLAGGSRYSLSIKIIRG